MTVKTITRQSGWQILLCNSYLYATYLAMLQTIKNIFPLIGHHRYRIAGSLILGILMAGIKTAHVYMVKPIFTTGFSPESTLPDILKLVGIIVGLALLNFPLRYLHFYWMQYAINDAVCILRTKIYKKIQAVPLSFYSKSKQGNLLSTIMNDTGTYSNGISSTINLIREPITIVGLFGVALYHSWELTLTMLVVLPILITIFTIFGKKIRAHQSEVQDRLADMTHVSSEGIAGQKLTKAFNLQNYILKSFDDFQDSFFNFQMKTAKVRFITHPLVEVITISGLSLVIIIAHMMVTKGSIDTGTFLSFLAAMAVIQDPLRKANDANLKINQARAAEKRILSFLSTKDEIDEGTITKESFDKEISVDHLSFSYDGEGKVLDDISFTVRKNEKVALVGLSGSGKSTFINLLLGLYPVANNSIKIDNISIDEYSLYALRKHFALVSQDIFLFNTTILENLKLGRDFSDKDIEEALEVAHANEFVKDLPEGLETIIGDRGVRLSGGQAQRITIARAFLQNSPILLFDEATSALDNESEKIVQKSLARLSSNKTVIAIAHRLSTIQEFDKIIVLKEGKIVERGKHNDLINMDGEYKKLYELSLKS